MPKEEKYIPRSLNDAVKYLLRVLPHNYIYLMKGMRKDELWKLNLGNKEHGIPAFGTMIRNNFELWKHNDWIKKDCGTIDPNEVTIMIIEELHKRILEWDLPK